jgi:hypothetical protein
MLLPVDLIKMKVKMKMKMKMKVKVGAAGEEGVALVVATGEVMVIPIVMVVTGMVVTRMVTVITIPYAFPLLVPR